MGRGMCWRLSHHQKDFPALPWWVPVHLISFTQRSPEKTNLLGKRRKLCHCVLLSCTLGGTDTMPMGLGLCKQVMAASSCQAAAARGWGEACRLLPGLRVYLPLWNNGEKPKEDPRTGSSAATLVSSPPEHLGLAVLLSGPLLPP